MCWPQPSQLALPQIPHVTRAHMIGPFVLSIRRTVTYPRAGILTAIVQIPPGYSRGMTTHAFSQPGALPAPMLTGPIDAVRALDMDSARASIAAQRETDR